MNICVVGTGYVGLVTGACLADFGMNVVCVDKDEAKISALQAGRIPIYEPGLEEIVAKNERAGRLRFTTDLKFGIESALAIFIAVGTPPNPDGSPDLTFVRQVAEAIARYMNGYKVVVTKSTVPTGTGKMIEQILRSKDGKSEFSVVSNPEFLREGSAIADFLRPDRIVIGASDARAIEVMKEIYGPLFLVETPFVITDVASAELIKYASNGFLAVKISFINEIARLCEVMGADVHDVARGMGLDRRIGSQFLLPGPGFGGSCFPKDTAAAIDLARQNGARFRIIEAAVEVNAETKARMIEKIAAAAGPIAGRTVAVLGLSFKPETDDIRESPALAVISDLVAAGASVRAFDPAAMPNAKAVFPDLYYAKDAYDCADGADVLVIATEWNEFRALDFGRLARLLKSKTVVDLRNVYDPAELKAAGWRYAGVGRS
jgi:UDPglucose 6-dehydrogenase